MCVRLDVCWINVSVLVWIGLVCVFLGVYWIGVCVCLDVCWISVSVLVCIGLVCVDIDVCWISVCLSWCILD